MSELFFSLNCGVSFPMTRTTKGNQIFQSVCLFVVCEKSERNDMMGIGSGLKAMLTGMIVPRLRLSFLGGPVRSTMVNGATFVLRMKRAVTRRILTNPCAECSASLCFNGLRAGKVRPAANTLKFFKRLRASATRGVLAIFRTVLSTSVSRSGWRHGKIGPAMSAWHNDSGSAALEYYFV